MAIPRVNYSEHLLTGIFGGLKAPNAALSAFQVNRDFPATLFFKPPETSVVTMNRGFIVRLRENPFW
jgi:hypothetical protein